MNEWLDWLRRLARSAVVGALCAFVGSVVGALGGYILAVGASLPVWAILRINLFHHTDAIDHIASGFAFSGIFLGVWVAWELFIKKEFEPWLG